MAFEGLLAPVDSGPKRWRRAMLTVSLGVHGLLLAAGVAHSLWQVEEMPLPSVEVTLTALVPPPPPPPPPPAGKKSSEPKQQKSKPTQQKDALVEPREPVDEPEAVAATDEDPSASEDGEPGGVAGGVKGGVQGGVLGGVVGGVKPKPPPPKPTGPKMVSGSVGRQQLLINPNVDPYRVKVPRALARSGAEYAALLRVCVSAAGLVTQVTIIKGTGSAIDSQIPTVISRWRYRPLTIGGQATAFCYPLNYRIR
jgi:periplasmic protein TonB